jgi:hypothetical protein
VRNWLPGLRRTAPDDKIEVKELPAPEPIDK